MRLPTWISQHLAALRALLVLTVLTGVLYPLAITGIAQLPGLHHNANGSMIKTDDTTVGSAIIGQGFVDSHGNPLTQYFQTRPSAAGNGWDPTASGASNLGPESTVDTLPAAGTPGKQSLLTQVCARSMTVPVLVAIWLPMAYSAPVAIFLVLSLLYAVTGSLSPLRKRPMMRASASCATVNSTVVGLIVVITAMPVVVDVLTKLPGSTSRRPTRPDTGAVMRQ